MLKKFSLILLSFTFIAILSGCEAFKKPNPDSAEGSPEGAIEEYKENEEMPSENTEEGIKEEPAENSEAENRNSSSETSTTPPSETKTEEKSNQPKTEETTKETPKSEVKTFSITAKQFEFNPSSITVNEGDTIRISIKTEDATHGFVIPDFGINKVVNPGSAVTVEFVADKKGTFPFRCSVYCGDGHGDMTGSLTVK